MLRDLSIPYTDACRNKSSVASQVDGHAVRLRGQNRRSPPARYEATCQGLEDRWVFRGVVIHPLKCRNASSCRAPR
jgi:hypothetical protein